MAAAEEEREMAGGEAEEMGQARTVLVVERMAGVEAETAQAEVGRAEVGRGREGSAERPPAGWEEEVRMPSHRSLPHPH